MQLVKTNYQSKLIKSFVVVVLGSVALTISAKLKIPFYPVPMTMQTFVVLFLGIAFGYKIGIATISLYLVEGIAGFPVFSNSPEKGVGLIYFIGPTMGYLVGFLVACFLTTFINLKDNFLIIFLKLMMSISAVYILGILWLGALIGWDKPIIQWGVTPFLLAEFFKISLLTLLTKKIIKFRKFI
jgi:biotin transport system substrate-specific component